jgi:hypothetical protein
MRIMRIARWFLLFISCSLQLIFKLPKAQMGAQLPTSREENFAKLRTDGLVQNFRKEGKR